MTMEKVIEELDIWISQPHENQENLGENKEINTDNEDTADLFTHYSLKKEEPLSLDTAQFSFDHQTGGWKLIVNQPEKGKDAVGSIVSVDLMRLLPRDAEEDDLEKTIPGRLIMRVTVLDEPRTNTRARSRIIRNQVDVDGDLDGDLNPAFTRVTKYSDWADYPPYFLLYTEDEVLSFPVDVRYLEVGGNSEADTGIRQLKGWLDADPGTKPDYDFGKNLVWKNILMKKSKIGEIHFFSKYARTVPKDGEPYLIDGSVIQMLGDHHHRADGVTIDRSKIPSRHDAVIKMNLRPDIDKDDQNTFKEINKKLFFTATPEGFAALVKRMNRGFIQSADPNILITWYDPNGVPFMEINWPVVWQDDPD
jgi:hypothetical protein